MDFNKYDLDPSIYDEMFNPDGSPRPHCRELYKTLFELSELDLKTMQERVTRSFYNEGITFIVYGDEAATERIIPIDCVPRLLAQAEWLHIESGLDQRVRALNLFLEDVYNDARIVADGVIPTDVIRSCPQYRIEMRGAFCAPRRMGRDLRHRPHPNQRRLRNPRRQLASTLWGLVHDRDP